MNSGRKNSKPNIGIHGHAGGTRPGETRKTPKNLSTHESEERGREESVGLYAVCMRERGGWGRGGCVYVGSSTWNSTDLTATLVVTLVYLFIMNR